MEVDQVAWWSEKAFVHNVQNLSVGNLMFSSYSRIAEPEIQF